MLNLHQVSDSPFTYRVSGDPDPNDKRVSVTFNTSVHRSSSGAVLGPAMNYATHEGTGVYRQEARWLSDRGVIVESY
jgi:hypothetical protein